MRYEHLTLDRLKEVLDYDLDTGVFRWKVRPHAKSRKRVGDIAGGDKKHANGKNYRTIGIDGRVYQETQLAFLYAFGRWARGAVGQENGVLGDVRAENLIELQTTSAKHDLNTREGRARYQKDYWTTNAEYRRGLGFKRYYGITFDDYKKMLDAQNGVCAICAQPETSKQKNSTRVLAVDHCHATGTVRQLLCRACNSGLGHFGDDLARLEKAVAYLRRHQTDVAVAA